MHDRKLHYSPFAKGDLVMCRNFTCGKGLKPKLLKERWTGPWKIIQVRGPVNYRITRKFGRKTQRVLVHHDRLKYFHERPPRLQTHIVEKPDRADTADSSEESDVVQEQNTTSLPGDSGESDVDSQLGSEDEDPFEDAVDDEDLIPGGHVEPEEPVPLPDEPEHLPNNLAQGNPDQSTRTRSGREVRPPRRLVAEADFGPQQ